MTGRRSGWSGWLLPRCGVAALVTLGALAVAWGPGAGVAVACDCSWPTSDAEAMATADLASTGTLVERIDPDPVVTSADPVRYVFDVQLVHKGAIGARVEVESALYGASCGATIVDDVPMFVVARTDGDRLVTSMCSGTRPIDEQNGPPAIDGHPPVTAPATSAPESAPLDSDLVAAAEAAPTDDHGDGTVGVLAAVAVVSAVALAGTGFVMRRRRISDGLASQNRI